MARIKIDPDRTLGRIDRRLYGQFIEHLGRCIYGGIYEPGSPLADADGFRRDVLEAARALRVPLLRWPGGNFVSGYHWTDGIGPQSDRPRRMELAWGAEESNQFGTDEFIRYCRALGTEPYICLNLGTGTLDEAQAWVEYCNGTGNTYWANRRRANGAQEPYNVRLWGLGNEMWGAWQIGGLSAEDYTKKAVQMAKMLLRTDPSIELVSCGHDGWSDWDRVVLEGLAPFVRYHSVHLYTGSADYWRNVLEPQLADHYLRVCEATIERVRYEQRIEHPIGIAFDEWNVWYRTRDPAGRAGGLEERYDLSDVLAVACYLNVFTRHCRSVEIANYAQMVNVIAPIFTRPDGLFLQTVYHPLRLYAELALETALDVFVDAPTVACEDERLLGLGPFSVLDVSATRDAERRELCVAVINRDLEASGLATRIELSDVAFEGDVRAYEVTGETPSSQNSFEQPSAVGVRERSLTAQGSALELELTFAPHSLTLLRARTRPL